MLVSSFTYHLFHSKQRIILLFASFIISTMLPNNAYADQFPGSHQSIVILDEVLDMVCFPPNAMITPPCPVPFGTNPDFIAPDPQGKMRIKVNSNDTTNLSFRLKGLSKDMVVTAWFVHFPPGQPAPHPIFSPQDAGIPPVAHMDTPVARTTARYSNGMVLEPNQFRINKKGYSRLKISLDYNPLKTNQVPLVNGMSLINQSLAQEGSIAEQTKCCQDFPTGSKYEPIGGAFLRKFDPNTGYQLLDENGRPELVRSPSRPVAIALFVHQDGVTSGMVPGIPTPPFLENPPASTGSFYLLGLFPLGPLGMN